METPFEAVAIGASAGGLRAVRLILSGLSPDFPGAILIAQHRGPTCVAAYRTLYQAPTKLPVVEAVDGELVRGGHVYLAPHGRHLEVDYDGKIYTGRFPEATRVRPSADLLFESVAACYSDRAVAVVLTGTGRDGAEGVRAVRERGGFVIAQDRESSEQFGMPGSAIETRRVDLVLPIRHIGFALNTLFPGDRP